MDKKEFKTKSKEYYKTSINFLSDKKVQNIIIIVALLTFLILGCWIRVQNLPLLVDHTTGEYIPTALDPFYFMRLSETMISQGSLPEFDNMRYPAGNITFSQEIMPAVNVFIYHVWNIFNSEVSFRFIDVISPIIYFIIGTLLFFWLVYLLTKSRWIAIISSMLLTFIPSYLYRSMAGFSDHEAIGMVGFFIALLCFTYSLKELNKEKTNYIKTGLFGVLTGFATVLAIACWGGGANFLFMIFPISVLIYWLVRIKEYKEDKQFLNIILFFGLWMIASLLFTIIFNFEINTVTSRLMSNYGIIGPATLLFMIIDFLVIKLQKKKILAGNWFKEKYRIFYSLGALIILGLIFIQIKEGGVISYINSIIQSVLHPFGTDRVSLTVAENKQPYLNDWISQIGSRMFWFFYAGLIAIGLVISKGVAKRKHKLLFAIAWIIFITAVLFSRISASSVLNGVNFLSGLVLFGGSQFIVLIYSLLKIYFNDGFKISPELIMIFSWLIITLLSSRSATRAFFMITPFACFAIGYFIVSLINYTRKRKDETNKVILGIISVIAIILLIYSTVNFAELSKYQAENTGPSATAQWQSAMQWVRENTSPRDIFIHWWDYGYWVQTLGERPTVTDGGHAAGSFGDHMIGRYVLTTPQPDTALSFMKTHNVSYLLIDQTDLGKYSAYSSIGDGDGVDDRESYIPVVLIDQTQTQETNNSKTMVYQGGFGLDEDIIYNLDGKEIFLPQEKTVLIGFIVEMTSDNNQIEFKQPIAVFLYNGQQYRIPIRNMQIGSIYKEFGDGIDATIKIIPAIINSNGQLQKEDLGSVIYLSPKVSPSLFAQLYLLGDPKNEYPTLTPVHIEDDTIVDYLKAGGYISSDFVYYQGFRGPITIWKVDYPDNILAREEFLSMKGEYGEFDNLTFTK